MSESPLTATSPQQAAPVPMNAPGASGRMAILFRALKHRNFQLFFSGQMISLVGTWMQSIAEAWLVYRLTGSAALLGVLGFVSQIRIFLLSPVGGLTAEESICLQERGLGGRRRMGCGLFVPGRPTA